MVDVVEGNSLDSYGTDVEHLVVFVLRREISGAVVVVPQDLGDVYIAVPTPVANHEVERAVVIQIAEPDG